MNANGVPPSSPRLRGTRYPGLLSRKKSQPQRGCAPCDVVPANPDGTALRFDSFVAHEPRVGLIAFDQPRAGGRNPVGIKIMAFQWHRSTTPTALHHSQRYPRFTPTLGWMAGSRWERNHGRLTI